MRLDRAVPWTAGEVDRVVFAGGQDTARRCQWRPHDARSGHWFGLSAAVMEEALHDVPPCREFVALDGWTQAAAQRKHPPAHSPPAATAQADPDQMLVAVNELLRRRRAEQIPTAHAQVEQSALNFE